MLYDVIDSLENCPRLARLDLVAQEFEDRAQADDLLRRIGEAAGGALVSLSLLGGQLYVERGSSCDGLFGGLPALFPRLEALELGFMIELGHEDAPCAAPSALCKQLQVWPSLRRLSARIEVDRLVPAGTVERSRARCAELCAASLGKKLELEVVRLK